MLKIHNTSERNVPAIALEHYNGILSYILSKLNSKQTRINSAIKGYIKSRLKEIISGSPSALINEERDFYRYIVKYGKKRKTIDRELRRIFDYTAFASRHSLSRWSAYKLAGRLKVNTCPYCNRQYTFTVFVRGKKITRPQFDHFYPQSAHPLLALSFFNLIPSCAICNLRKGEKPFRTFLYFNPYSEGYEQNARFTYIPTDYRTLVGQSDKMKVKIVNNGDNLRYKKVKRQVKFFGLEHIYEEHSDYIQEIVWKAHISKGSYFNWLQKLFGNGISKEDLYRLAIGSYVNEHSFDKRVLSKLSFDIAREVNFV